MPLWPVVVVPPEVESIVAGRADPDEYLDLRQSSASAVSEAQVRQAQAQAAEVPAAASGIAWQQLGPYNVGGRVVDVQADKLPPTASTRRSSGGGVWHSADAGVNWTPVWPDGQTQTMGALAQDAERHAVGRTGEANPPGGGLTYFGDGVYKSTDGGAHWDNVGLRESASIGRIAIDPSNPETVFAAAAGHVARSAAQRGLYRTVDGGKSWQLVLAPFNATTGAIDVAINPQNPQIVYAAMWDHRRNNGARVYGGVGSGLFRSKDGGDTWERLQNIVDPLPAYDKAQTGLKQDASLGRIGVTVAPSDPNRVYVVSGSPYGPDKGFYFSDDGGDSFHVGGRAYQTSSGYQWWFGRLWVDPLDKNHIFNADVSLRTSTDGGRRGRRSAGRTPTSTRWTGIRIQAGPRLPRQRRRHVPLGRQRCQRHLEPRPQQHRDGRPAVEPVLPPGGLPAGPQRMTTGLQDNGSRAHVDGARAVASDPALTRTGTPTAAVTGTGT